MKLRSIFNINKSKTYFDLSSSDRKKIVNSAIQKANAEQSSLVRKYGTKQVVYNISK